MSDTIRADIVCELHRELLLEETLNDNPFLLGVAYGLAGGTDRNELGRACII